MVSREKVPRGKISIQPYKRDKPEYFHALPLEKSSIIPEANEAETLAAALSLALDRSE